MSARRAFRTWTWTIEPTTQGCLVTVVERGEIHSPLFRFVSRYIIGYGATMERTLRALAGHFGEEHAVVGDR